jgi:hypothetical protein
MAIGKWSMYICAVLFLIIGLGALAVAVVPGVDEWAAEQTLDASGLSSDSPFRDEAVDAITDDDVGGVRITAWILALTFLPTAALFVWIGRWFKSMEGGVNSMFGSTAPMAANSAAFFPQPGGTVAPGAPVAHTSPMPTGQAPVPEFGDPSLEPPDPSAGGFIR